MLGSERLLPEARENDVIAIATAGAYGRVMSSTYNLREPAVELVLPSRQARGEELSRSTAPSRARAGRR